MLVTFYIDESGTHESGRTILGCWVGRLGQWKQFDLAWIDLLKWAEIPYFHSRKMKHNKPPFRGWNTDDKLEFASRAAKIAKKNLEFGFTITLNDAEYQEHYIAGDRPKGIPLDSKYGLCVRHAISAGVVKASEAWDRELDIHFVIERGHKNYPNAEQIFYKVKDSGDPADHHISKLLRTCTPGDREEFPGLQLADLNAYSAYQHYTRTPVKVTKLPDDATFKDAKKLRKMPLFNFPIEPHTLRIYRQLVLDEIQRRTERKLARAARRSPGRDNAA